MSRGSDVPDLQRMQAFAAALAESRALAAPAARAKALAPADRDPTTLGQRASVAIAKARAEQRRYRVLFDALPTAAVLSDRRGGLRAINRAARDLFALGDVRPLCRPLQHLFDDAAGAQIEAALERAEGVTATLRLRVRSAGHVEARALALGDDEVLWTLAEAAGGEASVARRLADKDEVIEHQRARIEALERESRTKDKFIAVLGHDLRAPLNAVLGWTQLMRREPLDCVGRERALATIERNARSQAALIEELLDVTRMNEGKLALEISVVDVAGLVRRAIEAALPDATRRGIDLSARVEAAAACAAIAGDRTRLEQIMSNLVANALKFTPAGGAVNVVVARERGYVRIEVRDTGKGIAPDQLPHVFKWLRQGGDAPPTREGLGLGLFIVRRLTELHGGTVEARSEGAGHGSVFTIRLPSCDRTRAPAPSGERLVPDHRELEGIEVLVVDDEADAVELLAQVLAARGATVASARDGSSALGLALSKRPDVVVTDLGLPDMDGYELARHLREEYGHGIGVVALSGFAAKDGEPDGDFDERLLKPVDIGRLLRAIQKAHRGALTSRAEPGRHVPIASPA